MTKSLLYTAVNNIIDGHCLDNVVTTLLSEDDRKIRELEKAVEAEPSLENMEVLRAAMRRYGIPIGPREDDPAAHVRYYSMVVAFDRRSVAQRKGLHFLWTNHAGSRGSPYVSVTSAGRGCKEDDLGDKIQEALLKTQGFSLSPRRYQEVHGTKQCGKWHFNISTENNLEEDRVREDIRKFEDALGLPVLPSNEQMDHHRVALAAWKALAAANQTASNHQTDARDPRHQNWMTFRDLNVGDIFQFSSMLSFSTAGSSGSNLVKSGPREYAYTNGTKNRIGRLTARVFLIARGDN